MQTVIPGLKRPLPAILTCLWGLCPALHAQSGLEVTSGLDGMLDRYLTAIATRQLRSREASIATIHTPADVAARQQYIRKKMLEEIGGFPEKSDLEARVTGVLDRGDYKIEKLIFQSRPHYYVTANVYVPASGKPPYPAVLGTAGHVDVSKASDVYQHAWAGMAKRGYLVLAYDPPGQGERVEYLDRISGKSQLSRGATGEHSMAGLQCLLTGSSIASYFIWDGIRAFDYLLTRPDVDPKRIAVTGNSGGGTQTAYLAVFEPRLAVAAPSCYITAWDKLWAGPGPQDAEQIFVDFLKDGFDFPDFLIAFAPKPILMATATRDFFPIDGARATYAEAQRVFQSANARDHVGFFEFDDTHGFSQPRREAVYRWLDRWLGDRRDDGAESELKIADPKELQCTGTGQVATAFGDAETTQSLNAAYAERVYAGRAAATGKDIATLVRDRLRLRPTPISPQATARGEMQRDGYKIEKLELSPEAGITLPALAFVPDSGARRKPAVIYLNPAGKSADAQPGGAIESLARAGNLVLAVDLRGWGESQPGGGGASGYNRSYQTSMRALLTGKSIAGMQTDDVLSVFAYLATRNDVNRDRISILGKGKGATLAMFAGVVQPHVEEVICEHPPESYMTIVKMKTYRDLDDLIIPGILRDFDLPDVRSTLGRRCVVR